MHETSTQFASIVETCAPRIVALTPNTKHFCYSSCETSERSKAKAPRTLPIFNESNKPIPLRDSMDSNFVINATHTLTSRNYLNLLTVPLRGVSDVVQAACTTMFASVVLFSNLCQKKTLIFCSFIVVGTTLPDSSRTH